MASRDIFAVCALAGVLFLVSLVEGQVHRDNGCPYHSAMSPFDLQRYLGVWYEMEKYPTFFESGGKCIYAVYSDNKNGTVRVRNTRIMIGTGEYAEIVGRARLTSGPSEGKLGVIFPSVPHASEGPYWVLATDYTSYAIVWGCSQAADGNNEFLWYLSRARNPDAATRKAVRKVMENLKLDTSKLVATDQADCPNTYSIV